MSREIWKNLLLVAILLLSGILIVTGTQIFTTSKIVIDWSTATELDTIGYNLYRSQSETDAGEKINAEIIPVGNDPVTTNYYSYTDANVQVGEKYYYRLETIDRQGGTSKSDPIEITAVHHYEGLLLILAGLGLFGMMLLNLIQRKIQKKDPTSTTSAGKEARASL
jgi:hypothetical protein